MSNDKIREKQEIYDMMEQSVKRASGEAGKLALTIWDCRNAAGYYYTKSEELTTLADALTSACSGKKSLFKSPRDISGIESVDELWTPLLHKALGIILGEDSATELKNIFRLRTQGLFSGSAYRRSYRSKLMTDYFHLLMILIRESIRWKSYDVTLKEAIISRENPNGATDRLALALADGDNEALYLVREALLGDNSEVVISHGIIKAVIVSGNTEMTELLGKVLLAAKLQEGLRQSILELMDSGTVQTAIYFLKLILDNNLLRFSSVIRAMDTWTGLGFSDQKPRVVEKCMGLAYSALTDPEVRENGFHSDDVLEIYFSLWAEANYDIHSARARAEKLINSGNSEKAIQANDYNNEKATQTDGDGSERTAGAGGDNSERAAGADGSNSITTRSDDVAGKSDRSDSKKYKSLVAWYFISATDSNFVRHHTAMNHIQTRDLETLAWITSNLYFDYDSIRSWGWEKNERTKLMDDANSGAGSIYPDSLEERRKHFDLLEEALLFVGNKNKTFEESVFPWCNITLHRENILRSMMSLVHYDLNEELIKRLAGRTEFMDSTLRSGFLANFIHPANSDWRRAILVESLKDKSVSIKELAVRMLSYCTLNSGELTLLTGVLESKSAGLRKAVLQVLKSQPKEQLPAILEQLLTAKYTLSADSKLQAGLELAGELKKEHPEIFKDAMPRLNEFKEAELSDQARILWGMLFSDNSEDSYTAENGYGLYDPAHPVFALKDVDFSDALSDKEIKQLFSVSAKDFVGVYRNMAAVLLENADYEYEVSYYSGHKEKVLLGNATRSIAPMADRRDSASDITCYPLSAEWVKAAGEFGRDPAKLALLLSYTVVSEPYYIKEYEPWYRKAMKNIPLEDYKDDIPESWSSDKGGKNYYFAITSLLEAMERGVRGHETFGLGFRVFKTLLGKFTPEQWNSPYYIAKNAWSSPQTLMYSPKFSFWRELARNSAKSDDDFKAYFDLMWKVYIAIDKKYMYGLGFQEIWRARTLGLVGDDVVYEQLLSGPDAASTIQGFTWKNAKQEDFMAKQENREEFYEMLDRAVDRIVEVECRRGELPTPLTKVASRIRMFRGSAHFAKLLAALGKESFFRGYLYSSESTKKAVLSSLLRRCYPLAEETAEDLRRGLSEWKIKDERLAQAVMYAPQWAGMAEDILGWKGLRSGVWFFHAHISENFSAEKETEVALYSPISPQQFNDGAFDRDWFFNAREVLGEKRFDLLYDCAKYITDGGSQHRRSQLYTDAVLGRLSRDDLEREIKAKRSQDKLRCYPLLPLAEGDTAEALRRYEFIQRFAKESKQFGAQRRASEGKAVSAALTNLAVTAGYSDVNRMTWFLESEKMDSIRGLFEPKELGDYSVWLAQDEEGLPDIRIEKKGKAQKTLPKVLTKDPYVLELKDTIKELREQRSRSRFSLENAMVNRTFFGVDELRKLLGNPVLLPLVRSLVWTTGEDMGFLSLDGGELVLRDERGGVKTLKSLDLTGASASSEIQSTSAASMVASGAVGNASSAAVVVSDAAGTASGAAKVASDIRLRLAHPADLLSSGRWAGFMRLLYEDRVVQAFKQVFREYYPITSDEIDEVSVSRRYAGHQVQPQKTVALLRGRGWTVDYEEGLQKVLYGDNLIARMYALADWFSPADIEAPTLETIRFFNRESGDLVSLSDVPPVVFSEVMRDIDLVVSVAHVGGVDPEASHSTVEMRLAIARELSLLLGLSNVSFSGVHAKIIGTLGNYSVHMGSGVAHQEAVGMLAILPVHSQARGRLFLPFADDDPKTAEIMSKIVLLSEDSKIKDPSILRQIE